MNGIEHSREYLNFRSSISQRKICVDEEGEEVWTVYDAGPREVKCPLVLLPPVSGQADIFFRQITALSALGYRVISIQYPVYWSILEFCSGFRRLIDQLRIDKVHIFGASLGAYLAQKFAEHTRSAPRVHSLILCNAFIDTAAFRRHTSSSAYWMTPAVVLRKLVMGKEDEFSTDRTIIESIQFTEKSLEQLSQSELASRLTLNCLDDYVQPQRLRGIPVMIMDACDATALSPNVKEEVNKCYPDAKKALLKTGGNYPYLSRPTEVNLFLQVHLNQFINSPYSAQLESGELTKLYRAASKESAPNKSTNSSDQ